MQRSSIKVFAALRENEWVREYLTNIGPFKMSKYYTYQLDPIASKFYAAWRGGDPALRDDLRAAFAFYPAERTDDVQWIISEEHKVDPIAADGLLQLWKSNAPVPQSTERLIDAVRLFTYQDRHRWQLLGRSPWFRAFGTDAGLVVEFTPGMPWPSLEDLRELHSSAQSISYRRAIEWVGRRPNQ